MGCQNEEVIGSKESKMEELTVEVTKGANSRVTFDGESAKWSTNDALYVYGKNGVRGTLYLTSGAGTGTATFKGIISGSKNDLTNAIFGDVTHEGDKISLTLNNVNVTQCDAPMFGAFSSDKGSISLDYICGLTPVTITEDGSGNLEDVKMGGAGINTIEYVDGEWVPGTTYADITLTNVPDGTTFYVPFFTKEEKTEMPITITVGESSYTYIAQTEAGSISESTAPELTLDESGNLEVDEESKTAQPSAVVVNNSDELAEAIAKKEANIFLMPGNYEVEIYDIEDRDELNIVGSEGTKVAFKNQQVTLYDFKTFTIKNCEILHMATKNWGMMVLDDSKCEDGVYTVSNCVFNGVGTQGIYINENTSGATYNIVGCTFNGDFGSEGAVTIQNNDEVNHIVNVTGCTFNNIPATSHKIFVHYAYDGWTLNTDLPSADVYWKTNMTK